MKRPADFAKLSTTAAGDRRDRVCGDVEWADHHCGELLDLSQGVLPLSLSASAVVSCASGGGAVSLGAFPTDATVSAPDK